MRSGVQNIHAMHLDTFMQPCTELRILKNDEYPEKLGNSSTVREKFVFTSYLDCFIYFSIILSNHMYDRQCYIDGIHPHVSLDGGDSIRP